jgi:asparagine synthase (glutamine-hydrolysing)
MPGFSLFYNTSSKLRKTGNLVYDEIGGANFQVHRHTLNKFISDKLFEENEKGIIVLEGIILNQRDLLKEHANRSWWEVVWHLYDKNGDGFFSIFRGSFSGMLYDRAKDKWIIFTDHIGTKQLYYYQYEKKLALSSEIGEIYHYLTQHQITPNLNVNAAYMLLSYGYMLDTNTLCKQIKKLLPGTYAVLQGGSLETHEYYRLPKSFIDKNFDETGLVERLDEEFRRVIRLQFEKDKEYNYKHFVSLSGGLDSRMVSWVAHELGYTNQINFTFSQSDYLDETTPKKIAADLKHQWIFKALDNGLFLKDIEEINLITGGNVLYYGLAHSNSLYKLINFDQLGIIHSGQVGEAIIGSILKNFNKKSLLKLGGAYSERFIDHVQTDPVQFAGFPELEISLLYQRAFIGANNGYLSEQAYTEILSPFCDVDFFEFCLSIPINIRINHGIYKKWILKKYPAAGNYVWEAIKRKISKKIIHVAIGDKKIPIDRLHSSVLRKLNLRKKPSQTRHNMNPLDYWYASNNELRCFLDKYFVVNQERLDSYPELRAVCQKLYGSGSATEKTQALTLVSAIKLYSLL